MVYGIPSRPLGKIEIPIGRNEEGKFVAHPRTENIKLQDSDKHAITLYTIQKPIKNYALLDVQILTGRTHQIRAHLSAVGHPVVGDNEYGPIKPFFKKFSKKIKVITAPRIFLHSHRIGFYNIDNEWVEFESTLPETLKNFLKTINQ